MARSSRVALAMLLVAWAGAMSSSRRRAPKPTRAAPGPNRRRSPRPGAPKGAGSAPKGSSAPKAWKPRVVDGAGTVPDAVPVVLHSDASVVVVDKPAGWRARDVAAFLGEDGLQGGGVGSAGSADCSGVACFPREGSALPPAWEATFVAVVAEGGSSRLVDRGRLRGGGGGGGGGGAAARARSLFTPHSSQLSLIALLADAATFSSSSCRPRSRPSSARAAAWL